jgi:hypothetical protein
MNNYFVGSTEPPLSQLDEIPELIVVPEGDRGNLFNALHLPSFS